MRDNKGRSSWESSRVANILCGFALALMLASRARAVLL